jgi:multidrug resistance efflux pump
LDAEKEQLSKPVAAQNAKAATPQAQEQTGELLRLRGEVGRLHLQDREQEQVRRDELEIARAKIPDAEAELARLTKLYSDKLISTQELSHATVVVELLKADANGDKAEAARFRLRQAEEELARSAQLRSQSAISQGEYLEAVRKAESLRAGTN